MSKDSSFYHLATLILHIILSSNVLYLIQFEKSQFFYYFILFLLFVSTLSLYNISTSNPGYLKFSDKTNKKNLVFLGDSIFINTFDSFKRELVINGDIFVQKYCEECNIYLDSNINHCYDCDSCVFNRDHHCIWLDTCITKKNLKVFMWLINSSFCLCLYSFLRKEIIREFEILYLYASVAYTVAMGLLCLYFWILVLGNISSADFVKKKRKLKIDLKETLRFFFSMNH
ncbi:hypothetical protein GVAV_000723 [Gurleya vavrai]